MKRHLFYDLFDKAQKLNDLRDADALFQTMIDMYGVEHIAYTNVNIPTTIAGRNFPITTFPENWLEHYFGNGYFAVDPIILASKSRDLPTDWNDISKKPTKHLQIFNERKEFGCGSQGIVFPLVSTDGERATFNINADMSDKEWSSRKKHFFRDFHIIAHYFHHSPLAKNNRTMHKKRPPLSERELETLKWAASGKSAWETSVILSVSERTVRFHLDQARRKLGCTTKIQAVAKAVAIGLINIS